MHVLVFMESYLLQRRGQFQRELNCGDKSSIIEFHLIFISINGVLRRVEVGIFNAKLRLGLPTIKLWIADSCSFFFSFVSRFISILLILIACGDIELNPGLPGFL